MGPEPQFEYSPVVHDENGQPLCRGCLIRRNNNVPQCERHKHYSGILADNLALIILFFKEIAVQTFPAFKGPEMKDWFRDDEDTLLPLIERRNIAT